MELGHLKKQMIIGLETGSAPRPWVETTFLILSKCRGVDVEKLGEI